MDLSKEEKAKFMSMVDDDMFHSNGKSFIKNLSKISYVEIYFNKISIDGELKHVESLSYAYSNGKGIYPITLNSSSDSLDFIVSIINRISPNMRIIYLSDNCVVYSYDHIDANDLQFSVTAYEKRKAWISLPRYSYCLYDHGAVVCDDILEQLCSDDNKKHAILTEYASHPESMSKEIRDKIKPIYDALPCGEKLLLELGCDV